MELISSRERETDMSMGDVNFKIACGGGGGRKGPKLSMLLSSQGFAGYEKAPARESRGFVLLVPKIGIEPTTFALRVRCSTGLSYFGGGSEASSVSWRQQVALALARMKIKRGA
jgi:hypothetical protein